MSFVAISKVDYPKQLQEVMHQIGLKMLPIARAQPGYIQVSLHQSKEHYQTMMYWEWQTQENHLACLNSNSWTELMSNFSDVFQNEEVTFSIETYEKLS